MSNTICLNDEFSTTRLLTRKEPIVANNKGKHKTMLFIPHNKEQINHGGLRTKGYFKSSYPQKSLLSIITVVYNGESFLEKTIKSVLSQPYDNIELIIIDGGSTDNTVKIIKKYEEQIDYWVSERDQGIYDAMNKGIDVSTGDGLFFLNAGDYFVGNIINNNLHIPSFVPVKYINALGKLVDMPIQDIKFGLPICHQGIIFGRKDIRYDLTYQISSDYDYYLNHGYRYLEFFKNDGYVFYDTTGVSSINVKARNKDVENIIYKHFGLYATLKYSIRTSIINILLSMRHIFIKRLYSHQR